MNKPQEDLQSLTSTKTVATNPPSTTVSAEPSCSSTESRSDNDGRHQNINDQRIAISLPALSHYDSASSHCENSSVNACRSQSAGVKLTASNDAKLQQWRSAGIALKQTLTQIANLHANNSSRSTPEKCKREMDLTTVDKDTCRCAQRKVPSKCIHGDVCSLGGLRKMCSCASSNDQDAMNRMLDDYNRSPAHDQKVSTPDTSVSKTTVEKNESHDAHMVALRQRIQQITKKAPAASSLTPANKKRHPQRSSANPIPRSGESESDLDAQVEGKIVRRPVRHRTNSQGCDHKNEKLSESLGNSVLEDAAVAAAGGLNEPMSPSAVTSDKRRRLRSSTLPETDSVANMADIESCSDTGDGLKKSSSDTEGQLTDTTMELALVENEPQSKASASFSVSYDVDSDDLDELRNLELNLAESDTEQEICISLSELAHLPDLLDESAISEEGGQTADGDADDEFECECGVCSSGDMGWITEGEEEIIGHEEEDNVQYYTEVNDGYNIPFSFNESEVSPLDLLSRQNHQRDIVEMMFQNVVRQMLSVYPELLGDQVPPPLSSSFTDNLPTVKPIRTAVENNLECMCPICLCDFDEEEEAKLLPCQHIFHSFCIQAWLSKSGTCPVCRHVLAS